MHADAVSALQSFPAASACRLTARYSSPIVTYWWFALNLAFGTFGEKHYWPDKRQQSLSRLQVWKCKKGGLTCKCRNHSVSPPRLSGHFCAAAASFEPQTGRRQSSAAALTQGWFQTWLQSSRLLSGFGPTWTRGLFGAVRDRGWWLHRLLFALLCVASKGAAATIGSTRCADLCARSQTLMYCWTLKAGNHCLTAQQTEPQ